MNDSQEASGSELAELQAAEQVLTDKQGLLATELQAMLRNLGDLDEQGLQDEVTALQRQLIELISSVGDAQAVQALQVLSEHLLAQHQLLFDDPQAAAVMQNMRHDEDKAHAVWVDSKGKQVGASQATAWCILVRDIAARQRTLLELLKLDPTRKVATLQHDLRVVVEALAVNRAEQGKQTNA